MKLAGAAPAARPRASERRGGRPPRSRRRSQPAHAARCQAGALHWRTGGDDYSSMLGPAAPPAAGCGCHTCLPLCGAPNALASLSSAFYSPMWPPSPSALMLLLWQPVTVTLVPPASNNQPGWKCRCANQSLCAPLSSTPARREIFAYYEDHWSELSYNQSWLDLFSGGTVTTIAVCEGHAVQEPGLKTARMSDEHLCFAHAHNVRVVPGCVGCDVWSGAPDALSRCPVRRALPPLCCGVGRRLLS
eukprot:COSAG01_NODE_2278_length_7990_cov_4.925167_5_plen_246_part_00